MTSWLEEAYVLASQSLRVTPRAVRVSKGMSCDGAWLSDFCQVMKTIFLQMKDKKSQNRMSAAKPFRLRAQAMADVDEAIGHGLDAAGPAVALDLVDQLERANSHLARHPATGSPRYAHELNLPGLRSWPITRFPDLVFYAEQGDHVDVWRVLHGARDMPDWLSEPDLPS